MAATIAGSNRASPNEATAPRVPAAARPSRSNSWPTSRFAEWQPSNCKFEDLLDRIAGETLHKTLALPVRSRSWVRKTFLRTLDVALRAVETDAPLRRAPSDV